MTRILITGITGMVGSHVADYILENVPDAQIFASRRWRSRDENIRHLYGNPNVKFIEADLTDRGSLRKLIRESKPEYVFHFAAQSFPETSFVYPIYTLVTNIIGTANFFEELRSAKEDGFCDPVIVSCSSSEVYGMPKPDEIPIKETNPIRAANPYSISKCGHDLFGQYMFSAYGLKVITTRLFSHTGPRRSKKFALSGFAYQVVQHEQDWNDGVRPSTLVGRYKIKVGNLNSIRTWSHIDDAVRAYWLVATKGIPGEVYNIAGDKVCTVGEALENMLSKSIIPRERFQIIIDQDRIRPTDITNQQCDSSKFRELTGWKPLKTLDDITQDLLDYHRANVNL